MSLVTTVIKIIAGNSNSNSNSSSSSNSNSNSNTNSNTNSNRNSHRNCNSKMVDYVEREKRKVEKERTN